MYTRMILVLTGGPGGGKSSLIDDLRANLQWQNQFVALPETVHYAKHVNVSPREKLFQRVMVNLQIALEDGLAHALEPSDHRIIICHRGSLDPLAFWLQRGWSKTDFFDFTRTTIEDHYQRYTGVLHLVTAADGAPWTYTRWPESHRPELAQEAIQLDQWLHEAWRDHPCYFRLDNTGRDWETKSKAAQAILLQLIAGQ